MKQCNPEQYFIHIRPSLHSLGGEFPSLLMEGLVLAVSGVISSGTASFLCTAVRRPLRSTAKAS